MVAAFRWPHLEHLRFKAPSHRFAACQIRFATSADTRQAIHAFNLQNAAMPSGSRTRWIAVKVFRLIASPFPGRRLAKTVEDGSGRGQGANPDVSIDSRGGASMDSDLTDKTGFTPLPKRQAKASMTCVVLAMFLGALSQTVVATTMPLIIADLGGFDRYTWAATSYLVAVTLAFPIVGRLSDIYGRRLLLLLGLAIFAIGSILLGFSESMTQVVGYRAVQGVGGGTIITCCYVSVADLYPPEERGKSHGLLGAVYGASFVVGPVLGGFLADALSWQWVFFVVGLAAIPVFLLTVKVFPTPVSLPENRDLDLAGMVALVLTVVPLLIALSSGRVQYEHGLTLVLGMLLFSLAMSVIFIAVEARAKSPILPLSLHADPVFGLSVIIMLLLSFGLYGSVLFLPLSFQVVFGFSAARSGALLAPMLLGMVVGGVVAGQVLSRAAGLYRIQTMFCAALMTVGLFLLSTPDATASVVPSLIYIVSAGIGIGGIVVTLTVGVQNHVPFAIVGVATSTLQFYRSVGGVVGLAVLGAVLATRFSSSLDMVVPETAKAALAVGQFEELQNDPRALMDSATADRLMSDLVTSAPADGAAMAQELLDALGAALREALDVVFVAASVTAALSFVFAMFFRGPVRSDTAPGGTADTDSEQKP